MVPLLFGGVLYLVESNYKNHFVNQVRNDALILASFSESQNEHTLLYQQKIIEDAVESGRLLTAQIADENGKLLNSWGETELIENYEEDFFFAEHNDTVFNIIVPRYDSEGNTQGELFLSYDEQLTRDQISQTYIYGIYLSLAYISITFTLTILLGRQVTKPIQQLRKASFDISMGQYDRALNVKTGIQDIQQLARTLEHMRHELVMKNRELQYHAMHDHLTGLPNRLLLRHRIDQALSENSQNQKTMAILLIDLDHFKEINDTLGHKVGDEVLKISAERLQAGVRQSDTVARLGGDEFAIILPNIDRENAIKVSQKLAKVLKENFTIDSNEFQVGASIGVALHPEHGKSFEEVLHCADSAMYASKRKRQSGATLYDKQLDTGDISPTQKL